MNVKKIALIMVALMGLIVLSSGCGKKEKLFPIPDDPDYFWASDTSTGRTAEVALDKAIDAARQEIANQIEVKIEALFRRFYEETGVEENADMINFTRRTTQSVVSQVLRNSKVIKQDYTKEGNFYRAIALVSVPSGQMYEELDRRLREQERLYTEFKASEAFKEMRKEIDRYEQFKKEQGMLR